MINSPDPRIDAFLDDRMAPSEKDAFLELLQHDASLRSQLEHQQAIDQSLKRVFGESQIEIVRKKFETAIERCRDTATLRLPMRPRWRLLAAAALVSFSLCGVWYSWTVTRPPPVVDVYEAQPWRSFGTVYHDTVRDGFKPAWICRNERQFERAFTRRFRQPLLLASMPSGISAGGISYSNTVSPNTINVLGRVDGTPVMIFVDRLSSDYGPPPPPPPNLQLFRREIGDLVLYEVTPFDRPNILPYFYTPAKD